MALSEDEQRLLEQMEAALAAEDPKLASTLRGTTARRHHRRRAGIAAAGFVVGIATLIAGMLVHPLISVVGFMIMLAATVVAVRAWQFVGDEAEERDAQGRAQARQDRDFIDRLEERWRRGPDDNP